MKPIPRIIPILLAAATLAHSQDEVSSVSNEFETIPAAITTARILGEIPDGTPPPPAPPKPEYYVAARDVLSTTTYEQGERTITIREIKPIDLPPPPPPAELTISEPDAEFSQRLAEYRETHPKNDIYNSELERLRTAYEGRESARIEREEYFKANPPQPKDITLNFWRTEKPASNRKVESK